MPNMRQRQYSGCSVLWGLWHFPVLEYRPDPSDVIVKSPLKVENGYIKVSEESGIGVESDEESAVWFPYLPRSVGTADRDDGSVAVRQPAGRAVVIYSEGMTWQI